VRFKDLTVCDVSVVTVFRPQRLVWVLYQRLLLLVSSLGMFTLSTWRTSSSRELYAWRDYIMTQWDTSS